MQFAATGATQLMEYKPLIGLLSLASLFLIAVGLIWNMPKHRRRRYVRHELLGHVLLTGAFSGLSAIFVGALNGALIWLTFLAFTICGERLIARVVGRGAKQRP
jgi:hypothetical protein